jgi:recombination protein RecR
MSKIDYPPQIRTLIGHFKRLPGIGPRSAERVVVWLLRNNRQLAAELAVSLAQATQEITQCPQCGFFATGQEPCEICAAPQRDVSVLCVVEQATDVLPIERTGAFKGHYHVLGGRISPLENVGPDDLRIDQLLERVRRDAVQEVILAVGSDVEGEATAHFLAEILRPLAVSVSRIAQGLPAGGGLESADELTLFRALSGRRNFN